MCVAVVSTNLYCSYLSPRFSLASSVACVSVVAVKKAVEALFKTHVLALSSGGTFEAIISTLCLPHCPQVKDGERQPIGITATALAATPPQWTRTRIVAVDGRARWLRWQHRCGGQGCLEAVMDGAKLVT